MKRPLLLVTVPYLGGILLSHMIAVPLLWLFGAGFGFAVASVPISKLRQVFLAAAIILSGWVNMAVQTQVVSPCDIRTILGDAIELATVQGRLIRTPIHRSDVRESSVKWRSSAEIEVDWIETRGVKRRAHGRVIVATPGRLGNEFFGGGSVLVEGVLGLPKKPVVEELFDYREYLRRRGVYYQLVAEGVADWRSISNGRASDIRPLSDRFVEWARANLLKGMIEPDDTVGLLWAMVLGWRSDFTDEISEPFMRSGTLHIFAISGLHIALITGILIRLLRVLQLPRAISGLILVPALWFYVFVTGWQASAIRATIMMTVIIGGWALCRPSDLLNSLAAAALIVLVWDPRQLFQASFQLSFAVVLSIALIAPRLDAVRRRLLVSDPFLPKALIAPWKRSLGTVIFYLTGSLIISAASWLGSLLLIATYFHLVTPISLLANVVIVPLAALTLMASLGSLLCGELLPWCTVLFNHSAWLWMTLIFHSSSFAATVPGAFFYVSSPSILSFFVFYGLLWVCLSGWILVKKWRLLRVFGVLILLIAGAAEQIRGTPALQITIFPLGGGAVFSDSKGSENDLLIDCGDSFAAERMLKPFLQAHGVNRMPPTLLTHGDVGHVGGYDYLEKEFGTARLYTSPASFRSPVYRRIEERLRMMPDFGRKVRRGDIVSGWTVLHPDSGDLFSRADDAAMVLRGDFFGLRILLVSDLGRLGQRTLLAREPDLGADIIVAGMPSQDEALLGPFLLAANPRLIVVASGEFPSSNRPSREFRERLYESGIPVVYGDREGAIKISISREVWMVSSPNGIVAFGDLN
ncbi:MAG: ComEC/Rec2 family competence protein [Verrucomicrobia bacterium]|nr:ComEC/Rec2 family competence protein [Verrucomicrobiota bacterium]